MNTNWNGHFFSFFCCYYTCLLLCLCEKARALVARVCCRIHSFTRCIFRYFGVVCAAFASFATLMMFGPIEWIWHLSKGRISYMRIELHSVPCDTVSYQTDQKSNAEAFQSFELLGITTSILFIKRLIYYFTHSCVQSILCTLMNDKLPVNVWVMEQNHVKF